MNFFQDVLSDDLMDMLYNSPYNDPSPTMEFKENDSIFYDYTQPTTPIPPPQPETPIQPILEPTRTFTYPLLPAEDQDEETMSKLRQNILILAQLVNTLKIEHREILFHFNVL